MSDVLSSFSFEHSLLGVSLNLCPEGHGLEAFSQELLTWVLMGPDRLAFRHQCGEHCSCSSPCYPDLSLMSAFAASSILRMDRAFARFVICLDPSKDQSTPRSGIVPFIPGGPASSDAVISADVYPNIPSGFGFIRAVFARVTFSPYIPTQQIRCQFLAKRDLSW